MREKLFAVTYQRNPRTDSESIIHAIDKKYFSSISVILLMIFSAYSFARPLPSDVHTPVPLKLVGEGEMTWFGLNLYSASLWTATGDYRKFDDSLPLVLHLTYDKNITVDRLVDTTLEEWKRLNFFDDKTRRFWAIKLVDIWPDVSSGDSITTLITGNKETRFFVNGQFVDQINDPSFGYALVSIWLHPDSVDSTLRNQLIP